jgi:hypothetical protein
MAERKLTVLELGCGYGGSYIEQYLQFGINFIALDVEIGALLRLKDAYPQVAGVCADAKHLPFLSNSVTKLLIQFPHNSLLDQGLQPNNTAFATQGWFEEFNRVLKIGSQLEIIGDFYLNPDEIINAASMFFELDGKVTSVSRSLLEEIGSDESLDLMAESTTRPELLKTCPRISLIKR